MDKSKNLHGHLFALTANVMWGLMAPIGKSALQEFSALSVTTFRMIGAAAAFWMLSIFCKQEHVNHRDMLKIFFASLFALVFNQGIFIFGLSMTSPIDASIVTTTLPIVTMIVAAIYLKEPITNKKVLGIFVGAMGALILILSSQAALSDKGSRGEREDKSGPLIVEMLTAAGYQVEETMILPDEAKALKAQLIRLADGRQVNLILTTGGTGFAPRDITPEATYAVADRNAPGIAEAMRYHSLSITPRGMLSRAASVLRGKTLIVNLPGSPKAVKENLEYILPSLEHGVRIAAGLDGECARK